MKFMIMEQEKKKNYRSFLIGRLVAYSNAMNDDRYSEEVQEFYFELYKFVKDELKFKCDISLE